MDDVSLAALTHLGLHRLCTNGCQLRLDVTRGVTSQDLEYLQLFATLSLHCVAFR